MSVGLACKSAAKRKEKLVFQKYARLFLSWMSFSMILKIRLSIGFYSNVPDKLDHWANRGNLCSIETIQTQAKKGREIIL